LENVTSYVRKTSGQNDAADTLHPDLGVPYVFARFSKAQNGTEESPREDHQVAAFEVATSAAFPDGFANVAGIGSPDTFRVKSTKSFCTHVSGRGGSGLFYICAATYN